MIIKKEKKFEITIQEKKIPIVSYKIEAGINQNQQLTEYMYNSNFYAEVLESLSLDGFAESYWDNYKIYNKDEITRLLKYMAEKTESKKLSKDIVIGKYIRNYLEGEKGYNSLAEGLKIRINQDGLLYADYDYSIIKDKRISPVLEELSRTIHDIRHEITTSTNEQLILGLGEVLANVLTIYNTIRELIIKALKKELNNNSINLNKYRANKNKAIKHSQAVADAIYESCIDNNENLNYVNITVEEFLTAVPNAYLSIAINEFMNAQKEDMVLKLFSIISKICRKEDGTKYTKSELEKALLNCMFIKEKGVEVFGVFGETIDEPLDTSRNLQGDLSFASHYGIDEQDYYGDGDDPRISLTSKKL